MGCQAEEGITDEVAKDYKFTFIPTDIDVESLGLLSFMSEKQVELLKDYDWVLHTDLDEFIIADPLKYEDLKDFMSKTQSKQTFCEGYEIFKRIGQPPLDYSKPILEQRKYWWRDKSGSYNKPLLSRIPTRWVHGFHYIDVMSSDEVKAIKNTGLYLVHLKHVEHDNLENVENDEGSLIPANIRRML